MREVVVGDALAQGLDQLAVQGLAAEHHLEAVVVRRVVAAGDRHARVATQLEGGEVGDRRRHAADVDDVDTGGADAVGQRASQGRAGEATIATDGNRRLLARACFGTEGVADGAHRVGGEGGVDDAANVVGLEDFGGGYRIGLSHDLAASAGG